jgi:hypothetical protein
VQFFSFLTEFFGVEEPVARGPGKCGEIIFSGEMSQVPTICLPGNEFISRPRGKGTRFWCNTKPSFPFFCFAGGTLWAPSAAKSLSTFQNSIVKFTGLFALLSEKKIPKIFLKKYILKDFSMTDVYFHLL